ncbi:MAG: hypothetical protein MJ094_01060 [Saccharofermentans sp.]|nr:hypothetical protein [Saccharofermentans sp.]
MLTLIKEDVYLETLALIDGVQKPDPILKGMQDFYARYNVKLYNIFITDYYYGGYHAHALTNKTEGCTRYTLGFETLDDDSWTEYQRLCALHGKDISHLKNKVLGTGFYFDRIWKTELIGRAGNVIKEQIEQALSDYKDGHMVINSGLGAVTVFEDTHIPRDVRYKITQEAKKTLKLVDRWDICHDEKVVEWDTLERLNNSFGGSLREYFH